MYILFLIKYMYILYRCSDHIFMYNVHYGSLYPEYWLLTYQYCTENMYKKHACLLEYIVPKVTS